MLGRMPNRFEAEMLKSEADRRRSNAQSDPMTNAALDLSRYGNAMNNAMNDAGWTMRNAQGMLNSQAMATSPVQITGQIDPKDISNGFYPYLRRVGKDDPEFLDIISWLISKGAPKTWGLTSVFGPDSASSTGGRWLPAQIVWTGANGMTYQVDALQMFNFPQDTLEGLQVFFQFGDARILEYYPGLRTVPAFVIINPVGLFWPEKTLDGKQSFRPSDADSEAAFPFGTVYTDATGSYVKEKRGWLFVSYAVWVKQ